jgi:hypothetical protein
MINFPHFLPLILYAAPISRAAILGIAVGGLVILLMILVAVCRPHSPPVFKDVTVSKPGNASFEFGIYSYKHQFFH